MKIQRTPEIDSFFRNCMDNLKKEDKNRFLGANVTKKNENYLQKQMGKSGYQEFMQPKEHWPSLFIRSSDAIKRPYNSTIKLDMIKNEDFRFSLEMLPANQLFNVSGIIFDQHRELNDWMQLRALDQPYPAAVLWQGDDVWMLDAPSESFTIDPCAKKARGDVLTFGLGIGYFAFMALRNPTVQSVTIVEKSASVIAMFNEYILPQFPHKNKVKIIEANAFDCFNEAFINQFDYVFVDIWKSGDDGFLMIEKLLEHYEPPFEKVDFWIETSCFEFIPTLILLYFRSISSDFKIKHENSNYNRVFQKISQYFDSIDRTVSDVHTLKDFMYNPQILREIVAEKS